jgi:hypothetical protein
MSLGYAIVFGDLFDLRHVIVGGLPRRVAEVRVLDIRNGTLGDIHCIPRMLRVHARTCHMDCSPSSCYFAWPTHAPSTDVWASHWTLFSISESHSRSTRHRAFVVGTSVFVRTGGSCDNKHSV